jgi:hypothetical protein
MTAKRQAEAIARRLRAAAATAPPATVTGGSSPILERVRRGTDHLDCWTDPVIASRLDHRLRLTLTGIRPLNPNRFLGATFDGPFVLLWSSDTDRRRNTCSIETRHRGGRVDHRLRLGHAVAHRLGVGAGDLVLVFDVVEASQLVVTTPGVLAAAALERMGCGS